MTQYAREIGEAARALDDVKELMISIQEFDYAAQCRDMAYALRKRLQKKCEHCGHEIKDPKS